MAAQERRHRILLRTGLGLLTLGIVAAVGSAGLGALHTRGKVAAVTKAARSAVERTPVPAATVAMAGEAAVAPLPVLQQGTADSALRYAAPGDTHALGMAAAVVDSIKGPTGALTGSAPVQATTPPVPVTPPAPPVPAAPMPVLPQGRTDLRDSLFAVRSGDTVVVHFDTPSARTRRAEKFDRIVRQTLSAVYGALADTVLKSVAEGALAASGNLVADLPARGIHLPLPNGYRLSVWPETRPGVKGPLVVAYRAVIGR